MQVKLNLCENDYGIGSFPRGAAHLLRICEFKQWVTVDERVLKINIVFIWCYHLNVAIHHRYIYEVKDDVRIGQYYCEECLHFFDYYALHHHNIRCDGYLELVTIETLNLKNYSFNNSIESEINSIFEELNL